jgi:hypothetical protein
MDISFQKEGTTFLQHKTYRLQSNRQYCSDKLKVIALAPLTPQFWGEMTKDFGFLPPELGGWGG